MKKFVILPALILILTSCQQETQNQQPQSNRCSVFEKIYGFNLALIISPYESFDREKIVGIIISSLKEVGEVHISSQPPFDALLRLPTAIPMWATLTIARTKISEMQASLKMMTEIKILANGCTKQSIIWENTNSVDLSNNSNDETEQTLRLVENVLKEFSKQYKDANLNSTQRPSFEVVDVDVRS